MPAQALTYRRDDSFVTPCDGRVTGSDAVPVTRFVRRFFVALLLVVFFGSLGISRDGLRRHFRFEGSDVHVRVSQKEKAITWWVMAFANS